MQQISKMLNGKKGESVFATLGGLAVAIATLSIALVITFLIISQGRAQVGSIEGIDVDNVTQCQTSSACNATVELANAVDDIPAWVPLIVIGVIGTVLLGLVAMFRARGR